VKYLKQIIAGQLVVSSGDGKRHEGRQRRGTMKSRGELVNDDEGCEKEKPPIQHYQTGG
jgi:hypothetical protein